MANKPGKRHKSSEPDEEAEEPAKAAKPHAPARASRSGRRGSSRRVLVLLALLAATGWFAPTIVARTSLGDFPLQKALAGIQGTISSGGRSFGWLSPVVFTNVQ